MTNSIEVLRCNACKRRWPISEEPPPSATCSCGSHDFTITTERGRMSFLLWFACIAVIAAFCAWIGKWTERL